MCEGERVGELKSSEEDGPTRYSRREAVIQKDGSGVPEAGIS